MAAPLRILTRPLDALDYDPGELEAYLDADARWRARSGVLGGPLRTADGQIAPVPAYMRLDLQTDRNGPVPSHRPELGRCWLWTGSLTNGYGYVRVGKRKVQAYRINYERWIGPIPPGAILDHLCRVRACVRPDHCDPTTYRENTVRSPIHTAMAKAARDTCPEGHPFDEANTYIQPRTGWRLCRTCQREKRRARHAWEPARVATDTHCINGHEWPRPRKGSCPTCNRAAGQRFRERRRAEKAAAS